METGNETSWEWRLGMRLAGVETGNEASWEWRLGMRLAGSGDWE